MVSDVKLYLNTVDAQTVFLGLQSKEAVGLLAFGGKMSEVWDAASLDDPYADYYLLKIFDAIVSLRNELATSIHTYEDQLNDNLRNAHIECAPFSSEKPLVKPLWFRTQYGYLGAQLISDFDKLTRILLTANWIGILLDNDPQALRKEIMQKITAVFQLPYQWQALKITRLDIKDNTEIAQEAEKNMGKLPQAIIDKSLRAPFAPNIKVPQATKQTDKTTDPPTSTLPTKTAETSQ